MHRTHRGRVAFAFIFAAVAGSADAQELVPTDVVLRSIAFVEALSPAAILLVQGVDGPVQYGFFAGAVLLASAPDVVLLIADARRDPGLTRLARFVSAGSGAFVAGASIGMGVALAFGAFPDLGWQPYAGSFLALSVSALFAALVDLVPYSIESTSGWGGG